MRVVFFGTPAWAVPSLERLALGAHEILAVVAPPSRRRQRRASPEPPAVARRAAELGIEVHQPDTVRTPGFLDWFRSVRPDAALIVAYGEILSRDLLAVPPHGFINLHFSLLPRWRGAAPVQWAIAEGDRTTGVTTMNVIRRLDAGDIYRQEEVEIAADETAPMLGARLSEIGADLLLATLDALQAGHQPRRPQDESLATTARQLTREDGHVDWSLPAEVIARRLRAFDPWPGAVASCRDRRLRLLVARAEPEPAGAKPAEVGSAGAKPAGAEPAGAEPIGVKPVGAKPAEVEPAGAEPIGLEQAGPPQGTVIECAGDDLVIACGGGSRLRVSRLVFDGGRPQAGGAAVSGRLVALGDLLMPPRGTDAGVHDASPES